MASTISSLVWIAIELYATYILLSLIRKEFIRSWGRWDWIATVAIIFFGVTLVAVVISLISTVFSLI